MSPPKRLLLRLLSPCLRLPNTMQVAYCAYCKGWGRIGRAVRPSWMSPWHTHANISTETQHISSSCITNLLPRKQEDAKKKKKKISMTFNFETVKKPLKGILKLPEKEMEIGLLITDSQPTPFYSPVILSAHVTVFLPFSVYRGTNARHQ